MAKTRKPTTTAKTVKKAAVKETVKPVEKEVKKDVKETVVEKAPKQLTAAKEQKKITAKKEPEKLTTAKEPEKISAKPEPEKIATKKVEQLSLKESTQVAAEEKAEPVKTTAKKKETKPAAKKAAEKKPAEKKAEKTPAAKKTTAKTVKADKSEKPAAKKETKKAAPKATAKKKAAKPAVTTVFDVLSLEECIAKMQELGVQHVYEDYKRFLMDEADAIVLANNIIEGNALKEKEGFDEALVLVTLRKVEETMDIKAADYKEIKKEVAACVKTEMKEDAEVNAAEYLKEFKLCEKILMIGQRKNLTTAAEASALLDTDVDAFVAHFLDLAYAILPTWQYDDVKFYEDFIYAVLSQYTDLFEKYQLRVLIDVADLYIKHGDFQHGDVCYGYILRDNQIKDYIYYRFAHVYEDIDFNKAKALAYESLQFVDARYTYYQNIMDIINK